MLWNKIQTIFFDIETLNALMSHANPLDINS